jgi:hypothetical protein
MNYTDLSDLTDLSSDEEYTPSGVKAKSKKAKESGYVLKNALRPPRTVQYSAKYLYGAHFYSTTEIGFQNSSVEQIIENHIDLNPEYQRGNFTLSSV